MRKIVLLTLSFLVVISTGCSSHRDMIEVATANQVDEIPTQTQAVTPTKESTPTTTPAPTIKERIATHGYPKLYNFFQAGHPDDATLKDMERLGLWDLVTIDAESPEVVDYLAGPEGVLRSTNPNLIITVYFSAGNSEPTDEEGIFGGFNAGLQPNWLIRDVHGELVKGLEFVEIGWVGYYNLAAPGLAEYFAEFIQRELIDPGLFDGVFYDWGAISEFSWLNFQNTVQNAGGRIDLDQDGVDETNEEIDSLLIEGMRNLHVQSREVFGDEILIHGNGGPDSLPLYLATLNGNLIEGFQSTLDIDNQYGNSWSSHMMVYGSYAFQAQEPRIAINLVCGRQDPDNFDLVRFTLASTLLFDGYYAFVGSNPIYGQYDTTWWYDEYSVDTQTGQAVESLEYKGYLGEPLGPAYNVFDPSQQLMDALGIGDGPVDFSNKAAETKVWRRDFEHGIVLVNPTNESVTVDFSETFRKIQGNRDPAFNDGSEVDSIVLPPTSGVILLRL